MTPKCFFCNRFTPHSQPYRRFLPVSLLASRSFQVPTSIKSYFFQFHTSIHYKVQRANSDRSLVIQKCYPSLNEPCTLDILWIIRLNRPNEISLKKYSAFFGMKPSVDLATGRGKSLTV